MIPWLLEITLSNLLLAIPIALLASYIQSRKGMFVISHMLWAFVLIKLITPPIYTLPIIQSEMTFIAIEETEEVLATAHSSELSSTQEESQIAFHPLTAQIKNGLLSVWGLGSVLLFIFSIIQMRHFRRSLTIVNPHLEKEVWVKKITQLMGITKPLEVVEIDNAVTPLVWWTGGTPKIYISEKILKQLSQEQRQHVLAHELAHIKRGDHWLRWVEWFACLSMWWNPLVWHARKELRRNEELCCDYDAIQTLNIAARSYAHTLVDVLEKLSIPESMTPRWVSTMAGTHSIERRIQMILSDQKPNEITGNLKRFIFALAISSLFIGF
ncbi:M56 family metallopeptidase, partial [Planctomycetota bacterium]|nr:M56 family metallopeptidase [Planctomycetota bacterium]